MKSIRDIVDAAAALQSELCLRAEDPAFGYKQVTAFVADAVLLLQAAADLLTRPAHGPSSDRYGTALKEIGEAQKAAAAIAVGRSETMHVAHLETVQALAAMRAITA